jgi:NADH-quinone oxidoreductase subunit K
MIGIEHYVIVSAILFVLGVLGIFLNRKNVIILLMAIELILLSVNLNLVAFSVFLHDLVGQIFAMFVLTVAAGGGDRACHPCHLLPWPRHDCR